MEFVPVVKVDSGEGGFDYVDIWSVFENPIIYRNIVEGFV